MDRSPGFGITVWAETVNGTVYLAEICSNPKTDGVEQFVPSIPEELGREASEMLLHEIHKV